MKKVGIIGVGQSAFVRGYPGSIRELAFDGFKEAMQDAKISVKDIDASIIASAPEYDKQRSPAGVIAEYLGLVPQPTCYVETVCSSSSTGLMVAYSMIQAGLYDVVAERSPAFDPLHSRHLEETRRKQAETFERYKALGHVFPTDVPANLVDRIHAHLLWQCEQEYGPEFWADFFREVQKMAPRLQDAADRDERYRITIQCFDTLPRIRFRRLLQEHHISLDTDIKSLRPTDPGWNRRLG